MTDEAGNAIAVQAVGEDAVALVTDLPRGGERVLRFRDDGQGENPGTAVRVAQEGEALVLANGLFAVRLPAAQERSFDTPVAASALPSPILAFSRDGGNVWLGEGSVQTERPVAKFSVKVLAAGPVYAEAAYRVEYVEGGYFEAVIRVADKVPFARVFERYDLGKNVSGDFWRLNVTKGWDADTAEIMSAMGQGHVPTSYPSLAAEEAVKTSGPGVGVRWEDEAFASARAIHHDSCWGSRYVAYYGVHTAAARAADALNYPLAMVVALHKGSWKRSPSLPVVIKEGQVSVLFPTATRPTSWLEEPRSDVSPFSCHEHDPAFPETYGQRVWGLLLANAPMRGYGYDEVTAASDGYSTKLFYGMVGLDRYKDFVLEWNDTGVEYPRVLATPQKAAQYREAVANDASFSAGLKLLLAKYYWFTGSDEVAQEELSYAQRYLQRNIDYIASCTSIHHHHTQDHYGEPIGHAESVLSWPGLSQEDRATIRGKLALLAYLLQEPDVTSAGDGSHHGNPNMGVSRLQDRANVVALIPDHPMHETWAKYVAEFMAYKMGTFMAPGGGWFEYGSSYHMHGYGKIMRGLMGVFADKTAIADLAWMYNRADFDYFLNLASAVDPRYGARTIPGMANSAVGSDSNYIEAMGTVADKDPEFAANLRWAWETGGQMIFRGSTVTLPAMIRPQVASKAPALTSRSFPGFGVIFRAHQGDDETCMFLRSGYLWSHWNHDQGNMILYSKGAVLMPPQPYQYGGPQDAAFPDKSFVRFGSPKNDFPHGWADGNVVASAFAPSTDFAWVSSGYPDWFISPGSRPGFGGARPLEGGDTQKEGAFHWNRMVMFMKGKTAKSPNYFVVRDVMTGEGKLTSWFNLSLLGRQGDVTLKGEKVSLKTEWPTTMDLFFPERDVKAFEVREDNLGTQIGIYNRYDGPLTEGQATSKHWVDKEGNPVTLGTRDRDGKINFHFNGVDKEQHVNLRLQSIPGQEIPWVI
ncbi:MAG: hypothetical protein FWF84_07355, partial [Kiritimatiellaeota bacterium]|nr:hypothetical protein [Kiritimatiellota bacterium]